MKTSLKISRSTENDQVAILNLLEKSKGTNLNNEEQSKQGFVQGVMTKSLLTKFQNDLGVYTIKDEKDIVAVVFTSKPGITKGGPIVEALNLILKEHKDLSANDIFQYGPVAIEPNFKGRGLLTQMLLYICRNIGSDFKHGLAFVDAENKLSLTIHRHYFTRETTTFCYNDRKYYVFLFDPKTIVSKYGNILL